MRGMGARMANLRRVCMPRRARMQCNNPLEGQKMKRLILGIVLGATTLVAAPLAMASPASAEPVAEAWYCWNARSSDPISRYQYYACPLQSILIVNLNTGNYKRLLNGDCANHLWQTSRHKAKPEDAVRKCTVKIYR